MSRSQVSASLGAQALDQGLVAGLAGFLIVAIFLLVFYRVLGIIATVAMGIYALYFYAIVVLLPIVLTLPGIAGLILTLGVAADANIVIFERVKEEMRAGRSVGQAITQGYRKGLTAILDANVVTFLVAFILFILATAGVRGFALTLGPRRARLAVHGRAGDAGDPVRAARDADRAVEVGARRARLEADPVRLHGLLALVLLDVRRDPAGLRPRDRDQRVQLRHRLRRRHADHRVARARRVGR